MYFIRIANNLRKIKKENFFWRNSLFLLLTKKIPTFILNIITKLLKSIHMEPKIIVIPLQEKDISSAQKALEIMNFDTQYPCSLLHLVKGNEEHLLWFGDNGDSWKIKPVFEDDFVPQNMNQFQISFLKPQHFLIYQKELYFLISTQNGMLITKVSVYNMWQEVDILFKLPNSIRYICKAFHISDDKTNARKLIGYCWRILSNNCIYTFPFFKEDFRKIIQIPHHELDFEAMEAGDKFFHKNILWTVYQQEEKLFFANPNSLTLHSYQKI